MGVTVFFSSEMDELRQALKTLPDDLAREAATVVNETADEMGQGLIANYPQGPTGNLKKGVRVSHGGNTTQASVVAKVTSAALIANIYEKGTVSRRTKQGWNRGVMPEPPENNRMIPRALRLRLRMVEKLKAIVVAAGGEVSE